MKRGLLLALIGLALMIASALPANADNVSVYNCCGPLTGFGEPFNPYTDFTAAAYPMYPYNSYLRITQPDGSRATVVRVNDSSPTTETFDVSWAAGESLGLTDGQGRCQCPVTLLSSPSA